MTKQPVQPVVIDANGVHRFRENKIVRALLDAASEGRKLDLNMIHTMNFTNEDRVQLAQLIGYSISGFADLSYVSDDDYAAAINQEDEMKKRLGISD